VVHRANLPGTRHHVKAFAVKESICIGFVRTRGYSAPCNLGPSARRRCAPGPHSRQDQANGGAVVNSHFAHKGLGYKSKSPRFSARHRHLASSRGLEGRPVLVGVCKSVLQNPPAHDRTFFRRKNVLIVAPEPDESTTRNRPLLTLEIRRVTHVAPTR